MAKQLIAVMGATGTQGGGVVDELLARQRFAVRVLTRNPNSEKAKAVRAKGCEVVQGDLTKPETLEPAFKNAYGAFLVTNFWDPGTMASETAQGMLAVKAAKAAGVQHLVWSTLPNCQEISNGKYEVIHFTGKALVDAEVKASGFPYYTFVEAPMYFQNFLGMMPPQPLEDGGKGWTMPMNPLAKVMHIGDPVEMGKLAARVFEHPDTVGSGQYLAQASELTSWQEIIDTLNAQGHNFRFKQVPNEVFDAFPFSGAAELREMMNYFEDYTYFGPNAERKLALARELYPEGFTPFAEWARQHITP
ncbi:MAG: NmrA/HSCARG family protein [Nitrospirales bacterium]